MNDYARYGRQVIFSGIGQEGQEKLLAAHVVLVGCGADGSLIADRLVRAGVGHLTLIDRDFVELNNLQRQVLYDEDDLRENLPKAVAAERKLRRINSQVELTGLVADLNAENAETLLAGAHLVMDGTDNMEARYLINDVCVKHSIPWVYCGVVASYGMTMTIVPHQTPCLRCLFADVPPPGTIATCDTVGVLGPIVSVMAGIAAAEGIKVLVGGGELNPGIIHVDLWDNTFNVFESGLPKPDCPACGQGRFEFLEQETTAQAVSLCGRDAVQIRVPGGRHLSLVDVTQRLQNVGQITAANDYLVRFAVDGYEITLFADGRAIIKGTEESSVARSLYARYVGV
ncbi:MAG: thiazole biosynthesis adenylyltransferase ThiF [Anaerolineae bacterium]